MANDKEFKNIAELNKYITGIATKLSKEALKTPLNSAGNRVLNIIEESFESETKVYNNSKKDGFVYGIAHHFGSDNAGRNKNTKIPSRGFLPINDDGGLTPDLEKEILGDCKLNCVNHL